MSGIQEVAGPSADLEAADEPDQHDIDRSAFSGTPWPLKVHVVVVCLAAVTLPFVLRTWGVGTPFHHAGLTLFVLVLASVLNVEIGRIFAGGRSESHQPHKALSAWAFACALLLPTPYLLLVVPVTYAHTRWRGLRVPLWKWVGSAAYVVVAALFSTLVSRQIMGPELNWMVGNGGRGAVAILAGVATFLAVETLLFAGSAFLNHAEEEVWLRRTLASPSFYGTEAAVLMIGGLLAAVWCGGAWFLLLFPPLYVLAQRAALHEPLRERAAAAATLAQKNTELEAANEFKIDLMGMLGHEIGNPLTSVVGFSEVAADALAEGNPEGAARAIAVVSRAAEQIRIVLAEILTMVTSEGGSLVAHPEECLLRPRLLAAASSRPPGMHPSVSCPDSLTALVQPAHLDQILVNLISNAEKYAAGAVRVAARGGESGQVVVLVEDAGSGVPAEFRNQLFEKFSRERATAGVVFGTGLGLFITRELARANGGDVVYRERHPQGSVFVVTLPASTP